MGKLFGIESDLQITHSILYSSSTFMSSYFFHFLICFEIIMIETVVYESGFFFGGRGGEIDRYYLSTTKQSQVLLA